MDALEARFEHACTALDIGGVVIAASNVKDDFHYSKAFGVRSLREGDPLQPLTLDSTFWIASYTKLLTAIAVLQSVERGKFTLDEDVTRLFPELKDIEILTGFDEGSGKPLLVKATKKITLRNLLLHTSGLGYDVFSPELTRWRASRGEKPSLCEGPHLHRITVPLLCEPGEGFVYSPGLDWAGKMIERTNGISLEAYMQTHIWSPLGITNMTFHLSYRPDMAKRLVEVAERSGGMSMFATPADPSGRVAWGSNYWWNHDAESDAGSGGLYASVRDYQKVLHSIMVGDQKLLGKEMLEELFRPQLDEAEKKAFMGLRMVKELNDILGATASMGTDLDYAFGGAVFMEDIEGRRRKGALAWGGIPNCSWWVDRESGVCGIYGAQLFPMGDPKSIDMFADFEKAVYA